MATWVSQGRDVIAQEYILRRLRRADAEEIAAVTPRGMTPPQWCRACVAAAELVWTFWVDQEPVVLLAAGEKHPGVWWAGAWSAEDWRKAMLGFTRWLRREAPQEFTRRGGASGRGVVLGRTNRREELA